MCNIIYVSVVYDITDIAKEQTKGQTISHIYGQWVKDKGWVV